MLLQGEEGVHHVSVDAVLYWISVSLPSSATGRRSTWKEYLYYSTTSSETPYNPLYRMDIASRTTHGECNRRGGGGGRGGQ